MMMPVDASPFELHAMILRQHQEERAAICLFIAPAPDTPTPL